MSLEEKDKSINGSEIKIEQASSGEQLNELDKMRIMEEVQALHILNEVTRNSDADKVKYESLADAKGAPVFKRLSDDEAKLYLYGKTSELSWRQSVGPFFYLENNDQSKKVSFEIRAIQHDALDVDQLKRFQEITGKDPLHFVIQHLSRSVQKYRNLLAAHKLEDKARFKLKIVMGENLATSSLGGDTIEVGATLIHDLLAAVMEENSFAYQSARASLESQYFHEFVHHLNDEDKLNNETIEEVTMLAEFLYDPLNNTKRNQEIFRQYGEDIHDEKRVRKERKWLEAYHTPYKKIVSRILLYELVLKGKIKSPIPIESQKIILANIDEYYAPISEEERDAILEKYLPIKKDDLYILGEQINKKLVA